ncbi:MAG: Macrocin-O-methyltransferase protein [Fibrobacteres bacterium]|nr:Macrocin-O-methyltransferase protein [Fibrobacterota bacterium]
MRPSITLIRVRNDGVPEDPASPFLRGFSAEFGSGTQFLEMPYPAYHSARDFALDFLDAMSKARNEWIYVMPDLANPDARALADVVERLAAAQSQGIAGAVMAARISLPDGKEGRLFTDGFTLDAMESGKAEHPSLGDPSWLLSFFVMKASFARSLAEEMVRAVDPVPAVLSFLAAEKVTALLKQGLFMPIAEGTLSLDAPRIPDAIATRALADFEANRCDDSLKALDYLRFAWGANPALDLHRAVLAAKMERYWLSGHMIRTFLQNNKGNEHGLKLAEALKTRKDQTATGYAAAAPLLDAVDAAAETDGEKRLFELVHGMYEQAVILELGDFPLRSTVAMALACQGTAKKVVTLSPFRARNGRLAECGRGIDIWKSAVNRYNLEPHAEASVSMRERLRSWGDAPKPDLVYISLYDNDSFREEIEAAFSLLKEGGILMVEGAAAGRPAAWKFWIESAEPALADKGRDGMLSWGRKTLAPLGGIKPPVTLPELWRRSRLPEPLERTMVTFERFRNAFTLARIADIRKLPGAIVECGVWKGGCSASMMLAVQETGSRRELWAFDSFQGLPRPTEKDGTRAIQKSEEWGGGGCEATEEDFRETLFKIAGLKDENIHIRKGWFQDTVPPAKHEVGPISILRLDGDWYDSVLVCLEHLYDQVVPGGYILIDDYGCWEGARKATDEFRAKRGISSPLITTDYDERYWIKLDEKESWKPAGTARDFAIGNGNGQGAR